MQRLAKAKKGASGMIASVVVIATVIILLFIVILVVDKVKGSVDRSDFDNDSNDTWDQVVSNSNTALVLLGVSLLVLAAFLIISILRG